MKTIKADLLPTYDEWLGNLRPASPVFTMALVDGRMTIFEDGKPAPDSRWQQALDAQRHEVDRVMVRVVSPEDVGPDDEWGTMVLKSDATGHSAPFAIGDLVAYSNGRKGFHRVLALWIDEDAPRHRSLCLRVKPMDVVVDRDAI